MISRKHFSYLYMAGSAVLLCSAMTARALSPYTVDANTLHLWHFDESPAGSLPPINAVEEVNIDGNYDLNVTNSASLMAPAYNVALDGALDTSAGAEAVALNDSANYQLDMNLTGSGGAFTYEALVFPSFDPSAALDGRTSPMEMICFDNESGDSTNRFFQFRMVQPSGSNDPWSVEFANIGSYVPPDGSNSYSLVETIDDFGGDLSSWTSTVILDANGGSANTSSWSIVADELQLNTTGYDGIEQYAFIRNGLSLAIGQEVRIDLSHSGASQDIGLYVGGTAPTAGVRSTYVNVYARSSGELFCRGFNGTAELGQVGWISPSYTKLFIARTGENDFEMGYYLSDNSRNVMVTRTGMTGNDGSCVGIYADVRATGDLGNVDNLEIWEQVTIGIPAVYTESFQAPLPVSGDHAAAASNWYHVAVTYTGIENTADNLKMYWTRLDAAASAANLIGSFRMTNDVANAAQDLSGEFSVGNECRGVSGENFVGLIDEVRVSGIARAATAFNLTGTPYSADGNTLLLFHFDDTHEPIPDSVTSVARDEVSPGGLDLTAFKTPAFGADAYAGFGSSVGFDDSINPGNRLAAYEDTAISMTNIADSVTGAFTIEALIQPGWSDAAPQNMQIVCTDDEGTRPFQWRFQSGGNILRFHAIATLVDTPLDAEVPTSGTHAIAQGAWYHVALAYNGNEGQTNNVTVYWTRLDSGATQANVLTNFTVAVDLVNPAHNGELCVGNELRDFTNSTDDYDDEEFIGQIDEVRISKVARSATQFVFADGGITIDPFGISAIVISGDQATLTWDSQSGVTYSILRKTDLSAGSWSTVTSGIGSAGDGSTSGTVPLSGADAEFYQVTGE